MPSASPNTHARAGREVAALYRDTGSRLWDRLETGRSSNYLEQNIILGRQREEEVLLSWLEPASQRRLLEVGCGRGYFARRLAEGYRRVVGVDLLPRFAPEVLADRSRLGFQLAVGDLEDLPILAPASAPWPFHDLLLREVLQDYHRRERERLLACLKHGAAGRPEKLYLTLRQETRWMPLVRARWPAGLGGTVDATLLLRWMHLETPYRLTRQREVQVRNFSSVLVEMTLFL